MKIDKLYNPLRICSAILALAAIGIGLFGNGLKGTGPLVIAGLLCFTIGGMNKPAIKQHAFTLWVIIAVAIGMYFPQHFQKIGDFKPIKLIVPLIAVVLANTMDGFSA